MTGKACLIFGSARKAFFLWRDSGLYITKGLLIYIFFTLRGSLG